MTDDITDLIYQTRIETLSAVADAIDGGCSSGWLRDKAGIDASHEGCNLTLAITNPINELREELAATQALVLAVEDIMPDIKEVCGFLPSNDEGCDRFKQKARAIGDALEGLKNV